MNTLEKENQEIAKEVIRLLNKMSNDRNLSVAFSDELSNSHRTLQQSFWRFIKITASLYAERNITRTDARNEDAVRLAKKIDEIDIHLPFI